MYIKMQYFTVTAFPSVASLYKLLMLFTLAKDNLENHREKCPLIKVFC